ncbi:MAG: hypothetical protein ACOH1Y_12550 [Propionicimonas sp.]
MSGTDKTRPTWVRANENPGITCQPSHDHSDGPCDLPADPTVSLCSKNRNYVRTRCTWWPAEGAVWGRGSGCCSACADQDGRKAKRRKERHNSRRELRSTDPQDL